MDEKKPEVNAADAIAQATIDETDLVRGVCGHVTIEGISKIKEVHQAFLAAGWKRSKKNEGFSKLEHYALKKGDRLCEFTVGNFLGWFAEIEVKHNR